MSASMRHQRHARTPVPRVLVVALGVLLSPVAAGPTIASDTPSTWGPEDLAAARVAAYEKVLREAEEAGDAERRIQALEAIASIHENDLRNDLDALPYWQAAWELRAATDTTAAGSRTRHALGKIYRHLGDWDAVEPLEREALREARAEGDSHGVVGAHLRLAYAVDKARPGDPEAETLYRRALEIAEAAGRGADVYSSVAAYLARHGRHAETVDLLQRSVELEGRRQPRDLVTLASYHKRLAAAYRADGLPELAARELAAALELEEERFGPAHHRLVDTLRALVDLLASQELYADAALPARRAAAIAERTWGADSETAREWRRHLLSLERRAAGDDAPLEKLAAGCGCKCSSHPALEALAEGGQWHLAAELAAEHLAAAEADYGPASLEVADALEALGNLHWSLDPAAAAAAHQRRLDILRSELGLADPRVAETADRLAFLRSRLGDQEAATALRRLRIESLEAAGDFGPDLARAYADLATSEWRHDAVDAAVEARARSLEVWQAVAGSDAPEVVEGRLALARSLRDAGRLEEAEIHLLALAAELEAGGSDSRWAHRQLDVARSTLDDVLRKSGR